MKSGSDDACNLVTAADSRLLRESNKNLLMGIWCTYQNVLNPISEDIDYLIASPWGGEAGHIAAAQMDLNFFYEKLLCALAPRLNDIHKVNLSLRSWEIILGPWLTHFIGYTYRRASTLIQVMQAHEISSIKCFLFESRYVQVATTQEFVQKTKDPVWQSMVDVILIQSITDNQELIESIPFHLDESLVPPGSGTTFSLKQYLASLGQRFASSKAINFFPRKYYLQATYLPYIVELRLHLLLGQLPAIRWFANSKSLKHYPLDLSIREYVFADRSIDLSSIIEKCLYEAGLFLMPTCYVEGFQDLILATEDSNLPTRPRVIFTSNSFEFDEVFKVWTGLATEIGAKYVVGQHGNNYGTWENLSLVDQRTTDHFLSWGWDDGKSNTRPTFNLKSSGRKSVKANGKGILLIQDMLWDPTFPRETDIEFEQRLRKQFEFISHLNEDVRKIVTVRLHHTSTHSRLNIVQRWRDFLADYPEVNLDLGDTSLKRLMKKQCLVVHCYDSTGFLETLAQGVPCMAFVPGGLQHVNKVSLGYYNSLLDIGLIKIEPKAAVEEVHKAIVDLDLWWNQKKEAKVFSEFISRYSRVSTSPAQELKCILSNLS